MCQGFSHLSGFLQNFVNAKFSTTSTKAKIMGTFWLNKHERVLITLVFHKAGLSKADVELCSLGK